MVIFTITCLLGYVFFPTENLFQYKLSPIFFLIIVPFLFGKYFLKKETILARINTDNWKKGLLLIIISVFCSLVIALLLFKYTDLLKHYLLSPSVKNSFGKFFLYELTGVAFTVAIYELFFRGFVMFYYSPIVKRYSIVIQAVFFLFLLLLFFDLPYWFFITYIIFTPFAGWIAYESKSLVYSYFGQLFFIIFFDAIFISMVSK